MADINSYGGFVKQYEIAVNPERLRSMNLTLSDIFNALEKILKIIAFKLVCSISSGEQLVAFINSHIEPRG